MAYSLSDATTALKSTVGWLKKRVVHEPLAGLADGTNKLFTLPFAPAQSGTLTMYDETGTTVSTGFTVDYDNGTVTFTSAPSDLRYASYTALTFTDDELDEIMRDGFREMQARYLRTYYLVTSGAETYISSDSGSVVDPTVGNIAFSSNQIQLRLFLLCGKYVLHQRMHEKATLEDRLFRESGRISSMMIDETRRPENIARMLEMLDKQIEKVAVIAAEQAGEDIYGTIMPGARSDEYFDAYEWWEDSRQGRGVED